MTSGGSCLGVCYADNHLFYSVNDPESENHLKHIGSIDFNFDVRNAIITGNDGEFPALKTSLKNLREEHNCAFVKILAPAPEECWTIVPRSVYEDASEREAHIQLLMHGVERSNIQVTWHPLSSVDYKLLLLRKSSSMLGFSELIGSFSHSEYVSEFEIGADWQTHSKVSGSFLTVHCQDNYLSIASFILGKLRGCTYLRFDDISDLPYLWSLYADKLPWMYGIHEQTYVFGKYAREAISILNPFRDDSTQTILMDSLQAMNVNAKEKTYGFRLESAFPAVLMSLNKDLKSNTVHENYNG